VLLAAGRAADALEALTAALAAPPSGFSRPLARLRLAEAALAAGDLPRAREQVSRFPFEPLAAGDVPGALLGWLERVHGLVARAEGDLEEAARRLGLAEAEWRSYMAGAPACAPYTAVLTDLGRVPVAGLVEPGLELGRTLADRALALAAAGREIEARAAADEALALADELSFAGYRERLADLVVPVAGG
jgi:tetratricopeptide (TPR) repeat protein